MSRWLKIGLALALTVTASRLWAQDMILELDPAKTKIQFTLQDILHTVHGSFALKSGRVQFNPATGAAGGLIVVDVASGESGNKTRDRKMHKEILESQRYPDATLTPTRLLSKVALAGRSIVQVEGIFRLHGADHPLTLYVPVEVNGSVLSARAHVVIPYVAWGLKNPSAFILRVSDKVDIDIATSGQLSTVPSQAVAGSTK